MFVGFRQPRIRDENHCKYIRTLPCVICGDDISVECAHIRMMDPTIAKPQTGIGIKPHDKYTVPLCSKHHRNQHDWGNEHQWWTNNNIDPVKAALELYTVSGDYERGCEVVSACAERSQ